MKPRARALLAGIALCSAMFARGAAEDSATVATPGAASVDRAIEEGLGEYGGGKVTTVEEPQYAGSNGALKVALDMPEDYWKEFTTFEAKSENAPVSVAASAGETGN